MPLPMSQADYERYLRSADYRRRVRDPALQRAGGRCERCGRQRRRLQVHHRDYFAVKTSAEIDVVEVLCGRCHMLAGGRTPRRQAARERCPG